ncbi:Ldh family oxidoreductase [Natrialba sp. PRR66]|uniref:Ldh family oxidoreductase n=1 Tax=Natrialba sp. PRR66 TaxID=3098146 RepID=UPI002B1DF862|nr:Ldh family oxidoreductase [Natrialba sp. PRR66]
MTVNSSESVRTDAGALETFTARTLDAAGLSASHADTVAETLVDANLRGIDTHGVVRLDPYVERIESGGIETEPDMTIEETAAGTAILDADGGAGQVSTVRATETAMELAAETGCAFVGVRNSNHFGTASYYTNVAAEHEFIGIGMTHAGPNVAPFGGTDPYFGTNPLSVGLPSNLGYPVTLDMATSVTAKGNVILAAEEGEEIPPEWAVDGSGDPITDPEDFHALRPMAGPKGYGLGLVVDAFCGLLLDTAFGDDVPTMYDDMMTPAGLGHMIGVIDVSAFTDPEAFKERLSVMATDLKSTPPRTEFDEVLLPGEPEARTKDRRERDGVPIGTGVRATLAELAETYGIDEPPWQPVEDGG